MKKILLFIGFIFLTGEVFSQKYLFVGCESDPGSEMSDQAIQGMNSWVYNICHPSFWQ